MKPLSPAEHDRLIEEFIQMRGVTRCPSGAAYGAEMSRMFDPVEMSAEISAGGFMRLPCTNVEGRHGKLKLLRTAYSGQGESFESPGSADSALPHSKDVAMTQLEASNKESRRARQWQVRNPKKVALYRRRAMERYWAKLDSASSSTHD